MAEIKTKKAWTNAFDQVSASCDDLSLMWELFDANEITEEELMVQIDDTTKVIEELEFKNMLRGESDRFDAVLNINSGAGGVESQDWAEMLMRMYVRYAEAHNYKVTVSNVLPEPSYRHPLRS